MCSSEDIRRKRELRNQNKLFVHVYPLMKLIHTHCG